MVVIGFGYKARQGKNTAALAMLDACPLEAQVRVYAFADALKAEVRRACAQMGGQEALISGFQSGGLMPGWVTAEMPKPRPLLQWWGTDYRRAKDPDYWVRLLRKTLDVQGPDVALIADVRFPNEADAIHEWGGYVVQVTRKGAPDVQVLDHPSEHALDKYNGWDFSIDADSVLACRESAVAIYNEIVRRSENILRG